MAKDKWADRDCVLEAVRQNGQVLVCAADNLRADREVVLEAVKLDGSALQYADESLRADRKVVLAAVRRDGEALICNPKRNPNMVQSINGLAVSS